MHGVEGRVSLVWQEGELGRLDESQIMKDFSWHDMEISFA